jgi:LysR family transcriptional activator of nhaA
MPSIDEAKSPAMRTLNFNHLYYFWVVARAGSITAASRQLRLTQPTLSTQIKKLEKAFGERLFARAGREMVLTGAGQLVMRYADEMFRSAGNMVQALDAGGDPKRLLVGASDAVPKLIVRSILMPLAGLQPPVSFVCREWRVEQLLGELEMQRMDMVITDSPAEPWLDKGLLNCPMGHSEIGIFGVPDLAGRHRAGFPGSLNGAPMVLPTRGSALREKIERWFDANHLKPRIIAEADDRALINYLAQGGLGLIPVALLIEAEISRQFKLERVGIASGVQDQYYAITTESRLTHPGVAAVFSTARERYSPGNGGSARSE